MTRPRPLPTSATRAAVALLAAMSLTLAACGGDEGTSDQSDSAARSAAGADENADGTGDTDSTDSTDTGTGDFPLTLDNPDGSEITLEARPERIVSLSPSATEILFALGAGDQVVAVDEFSTYPEEAPVTDLSGLQPNIEAIAGYEPDLVVVSNDIDGVVASLDDLGIPTLINPAPESVDDGWDSLAALGTAAGRVDETAELVADMRQGIETALDEAGDAGEGLRVYHELSPEYYSASSHSFIGDVYDHFGMTNIADEADTDGMGYPQLTEEAIIEADPQLIVITDDTGVTPEDVTARPGWSEISAVRTGAVVTVDGDIASRWGPRLPELVETLAGAVSEVNAPTGR